MDLATGLSFSKKLSVNVNPKALEGSSADFANPRGMDLFRRNEPFRKWMELRSINKVWGYSKSLIGPIKPNDCSIQDSCEETYEKGINFISADYLGLSSHPRMKDAAINAIESYGLTSGGSSALSGGTKLSLGLERRVSELLQLDNVVLFPTGWAAGYGGIRGLVGEDDHIVIDILAHNSLQEGARAATNRIRFNRHLDVCSVQKQLARIRRRDDQNAILVVTEGLFSMNSDTPDLEGLQRACHEYNAFLFVDVAHDLGSLGPNGTGQIGAQGMNGKVDIVMGSFPKTFGGNGGFVAMNSKNAEQRLRYFDSTSTFSAAMSPVQAASIGEAIDIVQSEEGQCLRDKLMANAIHLRELLLANNFVILGEPSPIVSIEINAAVARMAYRNLMDLGMFVNLVEYPAVARNTALFRLSLMSTHTRKDIEAFVDCLLLATADIGFDLGVDVGKNSYNLTSAEVLV